MRLIGRALLASAFVLGACAGGEKKGANTDTTAAAGGATTSTATTPAPSPAPANTAAAAGATGGAAGAAGATGAAAPITGKTHDVKMIGDEKGYRFDPANITIKQGDGVKWTMVSGGPHNVAFDANSLPAGAKDKLAANMPNQMSPLSSNFFMNPNETYTISFAGLPKGTYNYFCTPHLAMGMKGTITVQ
jgi:plastocyanin